MNSFNKIKPLLNESNDKRDYSLNSWFYSSKMKLFKVFHIALSYEMMTKRFLIAMIIIETFQIFSFSFNDIFKSAWSIQDYSLIFEFVQKISDYFLIVPYFQNDSFVLNKICFCVIITIIYLLFFLFIFLWFFIGKVSKHPVIIFKIIGELYINILFLPILRGILPFFNCEKMINKYQITELNESEHLFCFSSEKNIFISLGSIALFLSIFFGLCFSVLFFDNKLTIENKMNEFSSNKSKKIKMLNNFNYLSCISNFYTIHLFLIKLIVSVCFLNFDTYINDFDNNTNIILSLILFIFSVLYQYIIFYQQVFYSFFTGTLYRLASTIILFTNTLLLIHKILLRFNNDEINSFFEIWVLLIIFGIIFSIFKKENISKKLYQLNENCPSALKGLEYLLILRKILDNFKYDQTYNNIFFGYIYQHNKICKDNDCSLTKFIEIFEKSDNLVEVDERYFIYYIDSVYINLINQFPENVKLRISYGYFLIDKMKKINVAKMQLLTAYFYNPSFTEQFSLYRLSKIIEEHYLHCDDENVNLDIASSIIFNQYFMNYKEIVQKLNVLYIDFWMTFIQDDINIKKIKESGFRILSLITKLIKLFQKMQNIKPKDKESLEIYGEFLCDILNDKTVGQSYIDKSKEMNSHGVQIKLFDNDISKLSEDGSPVLITSPGMDETNLIISQITNSITRLFGYTKVELIGKDISILLPEELREIHQKSVKKFLKKKVNGKNIEERKLTGLALHKIGLIFPIKMNMILMPNLTNSANIAVQFQKEQKYSFNYTGFVIINKEMDILYFSSECYKLFDFNEKAIWKIKNHQKIQSEDRVNLSLLIEELEIDDIQKFIDEPNKQIHIVKYMEITSSKRKLMESQFSIGDTHKFSLVKGTKILENFEKQKKIIAQNSNTMITSINNPNNLLNQAFISIFPLKFSEEESLYYGVKIQYKLQFQNLLNYSPAYSPNATNNNQTFFSPIANSINNMSQFYNSPQKSYLPTPNIKSSTHIFDFKFYSQKVITYNKKKHQFIIDNYRLLSPIKSSAYAKHISLFQKQLTKEIKINSDSSFSEPDDQNEDEKTNAFLLGDNVYNTLNFTNYSIDVLYYGIDTNTMTVSKTSLPITKEGKKCSDLIDFFDEDTMKYNDYLEEDDEAINDKTKYEIKKIDIVSSFIQNKIPSNVDRLRAVSFLGMLCYIIISTISFLYYTQYLDNSYILTLGLSRIASLLNYTIISSDFVFDNLLLTQNPHMFADDQRLDFQGYLLQKLYNNSKEISNLISVVDEKNILTLVFEKVDEFHKAIFNYKSEINVTNPLLLNLSHFISLDHENNVLVTSTEELSFNEATFRIMSSIFSLTQYYNLEINFFDKDPFFLCYNSVNNYYFSALEFMNDISQLLSILSPQKNQLILIYISIGLALILCIALFSLLREPMKKMNDIILEIVSIKNEEIQYIVRQGEKFSKKLKNHGIGINSVKCQNDNEDENSKEEERENEFDLAKEKETELLSKDIKKSQKIKKTVKFLRKKLKRPITEDLYIIIMEFFVFGLTVLYFVMKFLVVVKFKWNLDEFARLFVGSYMYITNLNLLSNGIKLSNYLDIGGYDPNKLEMTFNLLEVDKGVSFAFEKVIYIKNNLVQNIIFAKYISSNFTDFYNNYLLGNNILDSEVIDFQLLRLQNIKNFTFETLHFFIFNLDWKIYSESNDKTNTKKVLTLLQVNEAKNNIMSPFMKEFCDSLFDDISRRGSWNRKFIIICYSLFFLLLLLLYFLLWRPVENWLDRDVSILILFILIF